MAVYSCQTASTSAFQRAPTPARASYMALLTAMNSWAGRKTCHWLGSPKSVIRGTSEERVSATAVPKAATLR